MGNFMPKVKQQTLRRTETVSVHHPDALMGEHKVERVLDSIGYLMAKRGRQYPLEYAVASRIRRAYDALHGQAGGAGDFERTRGPRNPSLGPPTRLLDASEVLLGLPKSGVDDFGLALIDIVVCGGHTLVEATHMGLSPSKDRNLYGRKLREALQQVARYWGWEPDASVAKIAGFHARLSTDVPHEVVPATVMHAGGGKVYNLRKPK